MYRVCVTTGFYEVFVFGVGNQRSGEAERLQKLAVPWDFVVEAETVAIVTDFYHTALE